MDTTTQQKPLANQADTIIEILEQASISTLLPLLNARQRWFLLMETMLGHGTVRGGRTRDFPFSAQRRASSGIAVALANHSTPFRPGRSAQTGSYTAYDLLVSLQCVEMSHSGTGSELAEADLHYNAALRTVIDFLFDDRDQEKISNLLGISSRGAEQSRKPMTRFKRASFKLAQILATLANTPTPSQKSSDAKRYLSEHYALPDATIDALSQLQVNLVFVKIKKAQSFLDACKAPFIQRGASYWCSQMSSRVRDTALAQMDQAISLLIDNDAVTVFVTNSDVGTKLEEALQILFIDAERPLELSSQFVRNHYPRLEPYYQSARASGHGTASVLPKIGLECRTGKSLWTLVTETGIRRKGENLDEHVLSFSEETPSGSEAGLPCYGRQGDVRLKDDLAIPMWYHPSGNQGYGFASIAFSLAELTYTGVISHSIKKSLLASHGLSVKIPATQKELLSTVEQADQRITFIKFDGDDIGAMFANTPIIQRAAMSIELENLMREAWFQAVIELMNEHQLEQLPVDLLYFGGDDLLMAVPSVLLEDFLLQFDNALSTVIGQHGPIHFTFAALSKSVLVDNRPRQSFIDDEVPAVTRVNQLLAQAKSYLKGNATINDPAELPLPDSLKPNIKARRYKTMAGLFAEATE